jgi:2-methylcitrate dehydratase PrpD
MTASSDALESPLGFLCAMSPKGHADVSSPVQFHRRWFMESHGLGFKLFPMCYGAHRALDGMLSLMEKAPFQPDDVERIDVESNKAQFSNLVQTNPQNVLDAKFSMEFAMACAVIARRCTRAEFNLEFVHRPDVRNLIARTNRIYIETKRHEGDGLIVHLKDGRRLEQRFTYPLGHARRPAPPEAFWTKFEDCVEGAFEPGVDRQLFEQLQSIERLPSLSNLPVTREH